MNDAVSRIESLVKDSNSNRPSADSARQQQPAALKPEPSISDILSTYKVLPARIHTKSTGIQAAAPEMVTSSEALPAQPNAFNAQSSENTTISLFGMRAPGAYELVGNREGIAWSYSSHATNTGRNDAPTMLDEILSAAPASGNDQGGVSSDGVIDGLLPSDRMLVMGHDSSQDEALDRGASDTSDDGFAYQQGDGDDSVFSPRHQAYMYFSRASAPPNTHEQAHSETLNQDPRVDIIAATASSPAPFIRSVPSTPFATGRFNRTMGSTTNNGSSLLEELLLKQQESIQSNNEIVKLLIEQSLSRDAKAVSDRNRELDSQTRASEAMHATVSQVSDRLVTVLDKYVAHEIAKTDSSNQQLLQAMEEQLQLNNANNNELLREMIVDNVEDVLKAIDLQPGDSNSRSRQNRGGVSEITFRNEFGFLRSSKLSERRSTSLSYVEDTKFESDDNTHVTSETSSLGDDSGSVDSEQSSAPRFNVLASDFEGSLLEEVKRSQRQCRHECVSLPNLEDDIDPLFVLNDDVEKKDIFWLWENPDEFLRRNAETNACQGEGVHALKPKVKSELLLPVPLVSSVLEQPATRARMDVIEDFDALDALDDESDVAFSSALVRHSMGSDDASDKCTTFNEYFENNDSGEMSNILSPLELRLLKGGSNR